MRYLTLGLRAAPASLALVALVAACDKPKPRPGTSIQPVAAATATTPPKKTTQDPLPAQPDWARPLIGQAFKTAFPKDAGICLGNTDVVNLRYEGASPGVRIEGWGWDQAAKAPIARVVLADKDGVIIGAGETGVPRPDVTAARKDVTSPTTGWLAITPLTNRGVDAYGVLAGDGRTTCRMGHINL